MSSSTSKASAFSCDIEVIVDSTPPKSVHGGDGDRAEFAIRACGTISCGGDIWVETNTACGIVSTHSKHGASMLLCLSIAYHLRAQEQIREIGPCSGADKGDVAERALQRAIEEYRLQRPELVRTEFHSRSLEGIDGSASWRWQIPLSKSVSYQS